MLDSKKSEFITSPRRGPKFGVQLVKLIGFRKLIQNKKMTVRTPGTPASKIDKTPVSTPASKIDRTPVSTPGGPRAKEEKIVVTVRLRPLSKREQLAKDQVAWECLDDNTIVSKPPPQERSAQPASFTFGT